ncbi:hypothetical protein A3Q56_01826 [Intoshia linei]|uniref:Uncharacterized protein n=1 Tax=Intoshia linei TaxID=1819745 RepID=A0A177BAD0_9BILA|nr:hypothetical protein A3Q56_01826 [Intoshia linei]
MGFLKNIEKINVKNILNNPDMEYELENGVVGFELQLKSFFTSRSNAKNIFCIPFSDVEISRF